MSITSSVTAPEQTHDVRSSTAVPRARPALWARVVAALASVIVSLVLAEVVAGIVRGHAFPFLNIYVADPVYGVRLEADTSTRLRSRHGFVTTIRTNSLGFRGPDWQPAPTAAAVPGRVLLLGDSQVLGYGVEEDDAIAAALARALGPGHEVLDAATPTWGPLEYDAIVAELAPTYRPSFVIFVANAANDWSEAKLPNLRRTTARDGWARTRTGEEATTTPDDDPLRRFLFGRSHLVFALRELFAATRSDAPPVLAASAARLVKDLPWLDRPEPPHRSRLTASVLAADATCRQWGCRVIVVGLPLDVQVHPAEWRKYAERPVDVGPTLRLVRTLLDEVGTHGLTTLDLLPVLRQASPGAFQPDDYHLSARGHEAFARALNTAIQRAEGTP